ncbi:putative steryl acetyl hydrolase mug81 [Cyberlindnera fabianii]|uniref:Putative steryl acetyl hydrolase mug81 n=1 Tax=Cyberlindnera fabianii TaxID=36022 RepID=A0A1V2L2S6_CYBFA|nr:putative steryl acetyl hydrolase mug81 [Cyberlindnera fabianii]
MQLFRLAPVLLAITSMVVAAPTAMSKVRLAATLLPKIDLAANFIISKTFIPNKAIPGYGKIFTAPNVDKGRIGWFVEAKDRTPDDPVILYAHGGGYLVGFLPPFIWISNAIYSALGNNRLSILLLDYTLTLDKVFPQQLIEFTETFNQLSKTSNNIILMGDSAGGHLCLQFLRHQNYKQFSGVVAANTSAATTGGIFLSPWVNVYPDPNDGTFKTNYGKDYLTARLMQHGTEVNLPERWMYTDPAFNMYKDAIDWDSFLPPKVFVSRGENEVLYDSIGDWTELAGFDGNDTLFTDPDGVHDSAVLVQEDSDIIPEIITYLRDIL